MDFGRSSVDEGTYKFKTQWLAGEVPLYWYPFDAQGRLDRTVRHLSGGKMQWVQDLWARLPTGCDGGTAGLMQAAGSRASRSCSRE